MFIKNLVPAIFLVALPLASVGQTLKDCEYDNTKIVTDKSSKLCVADMKCQTTIEGKATEVKKDLTCPADPKTDKCPVNIEECRNPKKPIVDVVIASEESKGRIGNAEWTKIMKEVVTNVNTLLPKGEAAPKGSSYPIDRLQGKDATKKLQTDSGNK